MTDPSLSPNAFSLWHESVRWLALGLLALLFAYTALQHIAVRLRSGRTRLLAGDSLRRSLVVGLVLVGCLPAASLGLLLAERSAQLREERISSQLDAQAHSMAVDIDRFLGKQRAGIVSLANSINTVGNVDVAGLTRWLQIFHSTYPDFLTMLATDGGGNIVAATSLISGMPAPIQNLEGQSVRDRPYFQKPMSDGQPFVSRVFQGRGLGRDPIVAISAPLVDAQGARVGIVEGSVNLRAFASLETDHGTVDGATVIVLDPEQRIIYASAGRGLSELASLAQDPMVRGAKTSGIGQVFEYVDRDSEAFFGASAASNAGWVVLVQASQAGIERQMLGDYKVALALLLTAIVLSLSLASAIARRVTHSVDGLGEVVDGFKLDGEGEDITVPAETPKEFRPIFEQMRRRSRHLRRAHKRLQHSMATGERLREELTQSIVTKEAEIEERTAELETANAKLEEINRRDALTGIANRRAFEQFEERAWRLCARENEPLTLIMIDIDYFKEFNDNLGHQQGDDCLRRVSSALAACATRPMDMVARYGGEEFVAVLTSTPLDKALVVADRMRRAVQALNIAHERSPRGVLTVSLGLAATQPTAQDNSRAILRDADKALYEAKSGGRNRVYYARGGHFHRFHAKSQPGLRAVDTSA